MWGPGPRALAGALGRVAPSSGYESEKDLSVAQKDLSVTEGPLVLTQFYCVQQGNKTSQ